MTTKSVEELAERYLLWLRNICDESPEELLAQCEDSQRQQLQQQMNEIKEFYQQLANLGQVKVR